MTAAAPAGIEATLAPADAERVAARLSWAREQDLAARLWRRDHTVWGPDPTEAADRLGWLGIAEPMLEAVGQLEDFAAGVRADGFTDAVVLGMGGSSLAPEVMRRSFPGAAGLRLHVLDSTHPDAIAAVAEAVPLETTLFVVSSKSGGTLETGSLMAFFRERVPDPGQFVAVTDPGTSLAELAHADGFRRVALGDPDIGGRYSALSPFGLVPAALAGIDARALLTRAREAALAARSPASVPMWLGLALGELARSGRDKLTLVADEPLGSFGLWAEQLVAESTGKTGVGIVPVADEPLGEPEAYWEDRVFVHLREATRPPHPRLEALAAAGHPVIAIPFGHDVALAAMFFDWELAVAVAGAVLQINPFDQPNVQESKGLTADVLVEVERFGRLPTEAPDATDGPIAVFGAPGAGSVTEALGHLLLDEAAPPAYVATMAYVPPSARTDAALTRLRTAVRDGRRTATTVGYGPRFLHSTGQLHKGGPAFGLFLQVTSGAETDLEVPGAAYSFSTLVQAQAAGDRRALRARGLPLLHVHIEGDAAAGLQRLSQLVSEAVEAP